MTLTECYALFGGNYQGAFNRMMKDERIVKYLKKFIDAPDYADLHAALAEKRYEDAFRAAHNLKGVSLNLELTPLAQSSSVLCEALRGGAPTVDTTQMLVAVDADYEAVVKAVAQLD